MPVDFLKIDGSFVKDMAEDPIDRAMVEAINNIGHVMGKRTIAEFADGELILAALQEIGVDFAQGYCVGRPRPFVPRLRFTERVA
jgi:EAL domain-containing protein (putative c-di-GMP-specific phosphodiesterase class I)